MTTTDSPPVRVLVVDDDYEDYLLVADLLETRRPMMNVVYAADDIAARTSNAASRCDVILLDYRLGALDGLEVLAAFMKEGVECPIILMTGQDDFDLGRQALRLGAADYVVKGSVTGDLLERAIRYAIERKAMDLQLRRFNTELEHRVAARTEALELATRELEGFTYSASHDLRTPLRAIMGTSRILIEDHAGALPEEGRKLLERQAKAARRLGRLLDDLLELSRIGRYELVTKPVDLSGLVRDVAGEIGSSLVVEIEPSLVVQGDPSLLRLLVQNLLENAQKFAKPGERGQVKVSRRPDGVISFKDAGVGFLQEYEPKIWEPFQRLVRDDEVPGTGVGLANVKRIVDRHHGQIRAEGNLGEGADFLLTLPG